MTTKTRKNRSAIKSTSISVKGDRAYVELISAYARLKKMTVAELVREAIDKQHGQALSELAIFVEYIAPQKEQL